jgi:hypothetical protein
VPRRNAAPAADEGVDNAEDMTHEQVLAWVARCELDADVGQSFRQKRVDGQELRKLFFLFRHNFVDYLARVKSQHGVTQYGLLSVVDFPVAPCVYGGQVCVCVCSLSFGVYYFA